MDESFRLDLLNYFRYGHLSKWDKLLSLVAPEIIYRKNAKVIASVFCNLTRRIPGGDATVVEIENYSGSNPVANKISSVLQAKAGNQLVGAYVHGSVGTSEEIPYSDFDGLVIMKNACLESPDEIFRLALALKETVHMMSGMDPLQHHGWFLLTESDLEDYPEYYFPHVLFSRARCLFGTDKLSFHLRPGGYRDEFNQSFQRLAQSILGKLASKNFLANYYVFKNLLSEFMLLPAVFIQAKTGNGIFKKYSFEIIAKELGAKYKVMDEISGTRNEWNYRAPDLYLKKIERMHILSSNSASKNYSGVLPAELKNKFDDAMLLRMSDFVNELKGRLLP